MTQTQQRLSFADYLAYDDGTDTRYELVDGELVPMSLGVGLHGAIIKFLERQFDAESDHLNLGWVALQSAVAVRSPRGTRWDTARIPDVTVMPAEQWEGLRSREAVIELNEPPPLLVVEVVSNSTANTDYRSKRAEYAVLDIAEYWIVDPLAQKVTVCTLVDGLYDAEEFGGVRAIASARFPALNLTAAQVLQAKK